MNMQPLLIETERKKKSCFQDPNEKKLKIKQVLTPILWHCTLPTKLYLTLTFFSFLKNETKIKSSSHMYFFCPTLSYFYYPFFPN